MYAISFGNLFGFSKKSIWKEKEKEKETYNKELETYKRKLKIYHQEMENFDDKKKRLLEMYNMDKKDYERAFNRAERGLVLSIYKKSLSSKSTLIRKKNVKRGKSEIYFLDKLLKRFHQNIKIDVTIANQEYYYPDFVYRCEKTDLTIDIEIDEPYTLLEKEPIHYLESNDTKRNDFFINQNWCVIRFTERQVFKETNLCLDLIESFADTILRKEKYFKNNVTREKQWTYEEAILMASRDERNNY